MASTATVVQKNGKAGKAVKASKASKGATARAANARTSEYHVTEDEFKGWPILQFWSEGNTGRFADLQLGVKKLKVILAVAADESLLAEVRDFVAENTKEA